MAVLGMKSSELVKSYSPACFKRVKVETQQGQRAVAFCGKDAALPSVTLVRHPAPEAAGVGIGDFCVAVLINESGKFS